MIKREKWSEMTE